MRNTEVGTSSGCVLTSSASDEVERSRFLRENSDDYGYGDVANTDTSKSTITTITTTAATGSSPSDSTIDDGISERVAVSAATSGRKIDLIRKLDFPNLLQSATAVAVRPAGPAGTPAGHKNGSKLQGQQPGSTGVSGREGGIVYLDHAGATLFGASQLAQAMDSLLAAVHGNPHSQGPVSSATATRLEFARHSVLRHFGVESGWSCVFTSGATAALKAVGEQFPWRRGGAFVHARASHNSVLGIREYAREGGADVECLDLEECAWLNEEERATFPRNCCSGCRSRIGAEHTSGESAAEDRADGGDAPDVGIFACRAHDDVGLNGHLAHDNDHDESNSLEDNNGQDRRTVDCLFAFPAECNATGVRPDLGIARRVKRGAFYELRRRKRRGLDSGVCNGTKNQPEKDWDTPGRERWWVLLDAAKFVGTAPLDLSKVDADFVAVSFYKIFGYPTGLGALIIRESAARVLRKRYFGGGTVLAALADSPFRRFRPEPERRITDGTEHFLGVLSLEAGFRTLKSLGGMSAIDAHTSSLARYLHARLTSLRHANGDPVVRIFGHWGLKRSTPTPTDPSVKARMGVVTNSNSGGTDCQEEEERVNSQGPVLAMCFLRPGGDYVGHVEVENMAEVENIQLRTGCFCNPGACQRALGLKDDDVKEHLERGHVCWDEHDLIGGRPTGLVRVSLGWMSTWEDANAFASFVSKHFVVRKPLEGGPGSLSTKAQQSGSEVRETICDAFSGTRAQRPRHVLEAIYIYPIKSCAPQRAGTSPPHASRSRRAVVLPSTLNPAVAVSSVMSDEVTGNCGSVSDLAGTNGRAGWPMGPSGLAYDREWALVDHRNRAVRLKQVPAMCKIRPFVDLQSRTLTVSAPGMPDLVLPLGWGFYKENEGSPRSFGDRARDSGACDGYTNDAPMIVRVCGNKRVGVTCAASASAWFTRFLGVPCSLVRAAAVSTSTAPAVDGKNASAEKRGSQLPNRRNIGSSGGVSARGIDRMGVAAPMPTSSHESGAVQPAAAAARPNGAAAAERAFANEAQYLLISRASVDKVNDVIRESSLADGRLGGEDSGVEGRGKAPEKVTTAHFRPNFVVNGVRAHEEDDWRSVSFGGELRFRVTGPCSRCSMINIDPETGDTSGVALKVLATYRRERANIVFGQFLASEEVVLPPLGVRKAADGDGWGGTGSLGWKAWVWEGMEVLGAA